ncbi:MAG: hypothetical protein AB1758_02415 [Candidatus Eremiobacterota bacterium]
MILYRASSAADATTGAHFAPDPEVARHFVQGGKTLYRFEVEPSNPLDARGGCKVLARAVSEITGKADWQVEEDWWTARLGSVFDILERDAAVAPQLATRFDWIYFEEDFPPGAISWRYLGKATLVGRAGP